MIINTLLIKLKDRDKVSIAKARDVLLSMRGKISALRDIQVQTNIRLGALSYDLLLITQFDSMQDLDAYLADPVHVEVAKYIVSAWETAAAVCYES
jgi:hypothetical protein